MCLVVLLGALVPRVTLVLLWLLTAWTEVLTPWWVGVLGFCFLPTTTLAYVLVHHYAGVVDMSNFGHLAALIVGLLFDTGAWGGGHRHYSKKGA